MNSKDHRRWKVRDEEAPPWRERGRDGGRREEGRRYKKTSGKLEGLWEVNEKREIVV